MDRTSRTQDEWIALREVLVLHFREDFSMAEIAEVVGWSKGKSPARGETGGD
jgi:hypothetical protein